MKLLLMIFSAIFGFFYLLLSPFLPARPERTEFLVDGVYQSFPGADGAEKTAAKLMELARTGDVDRVYEAFAPQVREDAAEEDLRAQIQALLDFLSQQVTGREEAGRNTSHARRDNISSRAIHVELYTDAGYPAETGLYSITVFPAPDPDRERMTPDMPYRDYAERGRETPGIFVEPPLSP